MNVNVKDLMITGVETIAAFDMAGSYKWTLDELQSAKIANTEDKANITGKQGRKLGSLKRNKAVIVSGTSGLVSAGLMETQVGSNFEEKNDAKIMWSDYLKVTSSGSEGSAELIATTTYKAVGTAGNEISEVIVKKSNGAVVKTLTQGASKASLTTGKFAYDNNSGVITFYKGAEASGDTPAIPADVAVDDEIVVHYYRSIKGNVLENMSDNYSAKLQLFIDAFAEDTCSNTYRVQFYIPKADFNGNFDFDFGDNQTVHSFEAESMAGACAGNRAQLWTYTVFGANEDSDVVKTASTD